ncbi:class I SAM-dependent methyltransferase [Pedobacter alluvionis]|uniref:Class I SAM-dependent methyltransferase n=1 Tax=Pedobacter alluvionis TaxID=475253 RepID=A0A497YE13_9SPHI|nr:class I SAM-dependent methyltransferase [Pedobacter alluvionis]RLJ79699.1 ubiquinone/menaquinone biosynthesis C-methylase UbiE [Pedobacter alluvionis]TFB31023.1 class I SAM-dependent methyltransferase [Pedobacter alluvionis]
MTTDVFKSLTPLFEQKSNLDSIKDFHEKVNLTFHNIEAKYYDKIHAEMWINLPEQVDRIINHLSAWLNEQKIQKIKVLDLGCGTGLAAQLLIDSLVGRKIASMFLLDPSHAMLERAKKRSLKWNIPINSRCGYIEDVDEKFDLIITSSVLHHIPDIPQFISDIENRLNANGVFISLHDPLAEAIDSETYQNRTARLIQTTRANFQNRTLKQKIIGKIIRILKGNIKLETYIAEVNQELIHLNVINTHLTPAEIWSITDIHVEGLPYSANNGISLKNLEESVKELSLAYFNTYCFFGTLKSDLPEEYKAEENNLTLTDDKFGRNFNSMWIRK